MYHDMVEGGVEPDVYTFNTLINACAQRGDAERACDVFDEMKRMGVAADVFSYNTMILAFEQAGDWHAAIQVGPTLYLMYPVLVQGGTIWRYCDESPVVFLRFSTNEITTQQARNRASDRPTLRENGDSSPLHFFGPFLKLSSPCRQGRGSAGPVSSRFEAATTALACPRSAGRQADQSWSESKSPCGVTQRDSLTHRWVLYTDVRDHAGGRSAA